MIMGLCSIGDILRPSFILCIEGVVVGPHNNFINGIALLAAKAKTHFSELFSLESVILLFYYYYLYYYSELVCLISEIIAGGALLVYELKE